MVSTLHRRHLSAVPDLPPPPPPPALPENVRRLRPVRCACHVCGAHTIVDICFSIGADCHNCGSYDLEPVELLPTDR